MKRTFPFALVALLASSGCGGEPVIPKAPSYEPIRAIHANIEYVGPDNEPVPSTFYPKEIVLLFPYIPGEIFGHPTTKPLYEKKISSELTFTIDLERGLKEVNENSLLLKNNRQTSGLSILPKNTRLSRIGTLAVDIHTHRDLGGGGFIDPVSRDNLILIYVDRPCHFTGRVDIERDIFMHDIKFDSPGFHWIRVHRMGDAKYYLREYPDTGPATFSIHLMDFKRT
jgi:hypothetical protein